MDSSRPLDPSIQQPPGLILSSSDVGFCRLLSKSFSLTLHSLEFYLGRVMSQPIALTIGVSSNKNVSRQHCRVWFNQENGGWQLQCLGKNGMHLNESFVEQNEIRTLENSRKSDLPHRIGVADEQIFFIMPTTQQNKSEI